MRGDFIVEYAQKRTSILWIIAKLGNGINFRLGRIIILPIRRKNGWGKREVTHKLSKNIGGFCGSKLKFHIWRGSAGA